MAAVCTVGVTTCSELLAALPTLALVVTPHRLQWLVEVSLGIQSATRSHEHEGRKSIRHVHSVMHATH